jgi:hypothetical protein
LFYLPSGTKEAVWMSQAVSSTENNLWIGSYSNQGVFAFWGENRLARGKLLKGQAGDTPPSLYRKKMQEKLGKGYKVVATFQNDKWTADPDPKVQLPESVPNWRKIVQDLVEENKVLHVEFDDASSFEFLDLYQISGKEFVGDQLCPEWRLDHHHDASQIYYQTRFDSPDDAVDVMKKMVEKRQKSGKKVISTGDQFFRDALAGRFTGSLAGSIVRPLDRKDLVLTMPDYSPPVWFW